MSIIVKYSTYKNKYSALINISDYLKFISPNSLLIHFNNFPSDYNKDKIIQNLELKQKNYL